MSAAVWADVKLGVKETLETIQGVGKVETRMGGVPTWIERPGPNRLFWEISIASSLETDAGVGPQVFQDLTIEINGFMPLSYAENSEVVWDERVVAVIAALRNNPVLRSAAGAARIRDTGRPQLTANNIATISDTQKEVRCHHCTIQLRCRHWFTYAPA